MTGRWARMRVTNDNNFANSLVEILYSQAAHLCVWEPAEAVVEKLSNISNGPLASIAWRTYALLPASWL